MSMLAMLATLSTNHVAEMEETVNKMNEASTSY